MSSSRSVSFGLGLRALAGLVLTTALATPDAQAYPLNPWGSATDQGYLAITPFLYIYNHGTEYDPYVYANYGITEKFDVIGGVGGYVGSYGNGVEGGFGLAEAFARYWFTDQIGLALRAGFDGNNLLIGPEIHSVLGGDSSFQFTINAGYRQALLNGAKGGVASALLAPEYYVSDTLSFFLEVDPSLTIGPDGVGGTATSTGLILVPGVGFALDPEGAMTMAVGLQADVSPGATFTKDSLSLGAWFSTGFGG